MFILFHLVNPLLEGTEGFFVLSNINNNCDDHSLLDNIFYSPLPQSHKEILFCGGGGAVSSLTEA